MKVLIAGATGLIGRAVAQVLLSKGIPVNYLTTSKEKVVSQAHFKGYYWNPAQGEIDLDCFQGVQAMVNLAGSPIAKRWTPGKRREILQSRIDALETLHRGLDRYGSSQVECLVSASAIGIYPDSLGCLHQEDPPVEPDGFLGEVVHQWEKAADRFASFGIEVSKVRIGLVLARQGGALPKMARPIRNFMGAPMGSGQQWQSWIHITDLAQMIVFLLENNLGGVYNGVAPNPVTNAKMTKELARMLERPLWLPRIPGSALRLLLGKMSQLLLDSQRVSSKKIADRGFNFQYPNICAALEALYRPEDQKGTVDSHYTGIA